MVSLWSFLTYYLQPDAHYSPYKDNRTTDLISESRVNEVPQVPNQVDNHSCPFFKEGSDGHWDWAYKAPALVILACNMVFLIYIMAVRIEYTCPGPGGGL